MSTDLGTVDPTANIEATAPASGATQYDERRKLDKSMARAVMWTTIGRWSVQPITWFSGVIVARMLTPGDYGLVGMAGLFWGLIMLVSEFGVGQAVITMRSLDRDQIAQLNTFSVLLGTTGFLISCAFSVPLGHFFHSRELPLIIVAVSTTCIIQSFQTVPDALLQKQLRFRLIASLDITKALMQAGGTILLAWFGFGYWTLVGSLVIGSILATLLTLSFSRHSFRFPRYSSVGHAIKFSRDVIVSRVCWYCYSNSDFTVAGRTLGQVALGSYSLAWYTASVPLEKITNMVARVTPAFFSAVQTQKDELRRYMLRITEVLSIATFPASFGLAMTAREFILILLGPKWMGAVVPLRLLAFYISFRSISSFFPNLLNAIGQSRFVMWNTVCAVLLFPASFWVASRWGLAGIALAWILLYPVITIPQYIRVFRCIELSASEYMKSLYPAGTSSIGLVLAVLIATVAMPSHWPLAVRFTIEIVAGSGVYFGLLFTVHREHMRGFVAAVRQLRGRA